MKLTDKQISDVVKTYRNRPVALNVLDAVNPNENEHTRFLCQLLNYKKCGMPVFLKSFLAMIAEVAEASFTELTDDDISKAAIKDQDGYIDCLITVGNYSIIIENKVCGACDQDKQLSSYIGKITKKHPLNKIFAVYLTLAGGEPSTHSLPDELRSELERDHRFILLSYHTNILRWLESEVLPNCEYRETRLIHSIILYIDHLKGMLGQREDQQTLSDKLIPILGCSMDSDGYKTLQKLVAEYSEKNASQAELDVDRSDFRAAINILLREIEIRKPYLNAYSVAYALKWMFRDDPPPPYKFTWKAGFADVRPYSSSMLICNGERYVQLTDGRIRIHLCCSPKGIKAGPYILGPEGNSDYFAETVFGKNYLEQNGLKHGKDVYGMPFPSFDEERTPLLDVCLHVKKLVDILKNAPLQESQTNT